MYPAELVQPMKQDLTQVGFKQLTTSAAVDQSRGEGERERNGGQTTGRE